MIRTTVRNAYVPMEARQDFQASALSGKTIHGAPSLGRLPAEFHDSARSATYVVYSYVIPIAWVDAAGKWVQPHTKYSVTTSKHQGVARRVTMKENA